MLAPDYLRLWFAWLSCCDSCVVGSCISFRRRAVSSVSRPTLLTQFPIAQMTAMSAAPAAKFGSMRNVRLTAIIRHQPMHDFILITPLVKLRPCNWRRDLSPSFRLLGQAPDVLGCQLRRQ